MTGSSLIPARLVVAIVLALLAMIILVIVVGVVLRTLDTNQALLALSTMLSGIAIAALTRGNGKGP